MKKIVKTILLIILIETSRMAVLLDSNSKNSFAPKARKLMTYPGYDERLATEDYTTSLEKMIERVKRLRQNVNEMQNEFQADSAMVSQVIDSQVSSISHSLATNNFIKSTVEKIEGS